jgi:hypothetical protein
MRWLLVLATLGLFLLACGSDGSELEDRVAALEDEVGELRAEVADRLVSAAPIVVSSLRSEICGGGRVRVVWVVSGTEGEGCWAPDSPCAMEADVGQRLPDSCR